MNKLVCSICGFTSEQKKFKWSDINERFDKAIKRYWITNLTKKR
jgi:ribosomal protein L37E